MKRPIIKPSQKFIAPSKSAGDWKESRLIVSVLSAAGTATLFSTVIMPLVNTVQDNKIQKLEELTKNAQAISTELEETKKKLAKLKSDIALSIQKSPFIPGSVYPLGEGLDSVVIGTDVKEIKNRLPEITKDEDESYFNYKSSNHPIFHASTYYISSDNKVDVILYHFQDRFVGAELIKKTLLTNFGEPFAEKKGSMLWKIKNKEWAILEYKKGIGYSYVIQDRPHSTEWGEFLENKKK